MSCRLSSSTLGHPIPFIKEYLLVHLGLTALRFLTTFDDFWSEFFSKSTTFLDYLTPWFLLDWFIHRAAERFPSFSFNLVLLGWTLCIGCFGQCNIPTGTECASLCEVFVAENPQARLTCSKYLIAAVQSLACQLDRQSMLWRRNIIRVAHIIIIVIGLGVGWWHCRQWRSQGGQGGSWPPPKLLVNVFFL